MTVTTISPSNLPNCARAGRSNSSTCGRRWSSGSCTPLPPATCPLDRLDPAAVMQARNGIKDEPLYLICRSGSRGRQACEKFLAAGFTNVINVEGGTLACVEAGLPVVRGKKAISLERQVRIAAGSLVLLGVLLGWLVHPAFLGLSAFVGAGLVFAGITDTCGMGMMLARMPWNQVKDAPATLLCDEGGLLMKLLIIGGVAGGASAAARARRFRKMPTSSCSSVGRTCRSPTAACPTTSAARSPSGTSCSSSRRSVCGPASTWTCGCGRRWRPSTGRRRRSVSVTSLRAGSTRKPTTS